MKNKIKDIEIGAITCVLNYTLNKFLPFIFIGTLLFLNMSFETWEPYAIMGFVWFIDRFSFKVGYSVAICEEKGLIGNED
tara:strand:+ start:47 stop:286 length:240 start_codon:yes stop_codon:yes gene_type:complete